MRPSEAEPRETVGKMEERLRAHPLFPDYERLSERFTSTWRMNVTYPSRERRC